MNMICIFKYYLITWGMIVSLVLRSCRPISPVVTSSITMDPAAASMMRNRPSVIEDFPAPVLPTMPIY